MLTMQTLMPDDLKECVSRPSYVLGGPAPYAYVQARRDGAWIVAVVTHTERTPSPAAEIITFNVLPSEKHATDWAEKHLVSTEIAWVERAKCH